MLEIENVSDVEFAVVGYDDVLEEKLPTLKDFFEVDEQFAEKPFYNFLGLNTTQGVDIDLFSNTTLAHADWLLHTEKMYADPKKYTLEVQVAPLGINADDETVVICETNIGSVPFLNQMSGTSYAIADGIHVEAYITPDANETHLVCPSAAVARHLATKPSIAVQCITNFDAVPNFAVFREDMSHFPACLTDEDLDSLFQNVEDEDIENFEATVESQFDNFFQVRAEANIHIRGARHQKHLLVKHVKSLFVEKEEPAAPPIVPSADTTKDALKDEKEKALTAFTEAQTEYNTVKGINTKVEEAEEKYQKLMEKQRLYVSAHNRFSSYVLVH